MAIPRHVSEFVVFIPVSAEKVSLVS